MRAQPLLVLPLLLLIGCTTQSGPAAPVPESVAGPAQPIIQESSLGQLRPALERYMSGREGTAGVALRSRNSERTYDWHGTTRFQLGSVIKVAVLAAYLQQKGPQLSPYDQDRLQRMIVSSDNDAAQEVWDEIGGHAFLDPWLRSLGLDQTTADPREMWGESYASPGDIADLMARIVWGDILSEPQRRYAMGLLTHVDGDQRWGISAGSSGTTGLKNGWHEDDEGRWWVHSAGFVQGQTGSYTIAVFTAQQPSQEYGIETVEGISTLVHGTLGR